MVLDRFALYELCAQAPERDARVLAAIHGGGARVLGEDFCGTAALSRAWARLGPGRRAIGVDHDAATLARAHRHPRVRLVRSDVMAVKGPSARVDLIAVLNFSIGELHTRAALVAYLRHARSRLRPGGCFVCDIYGGSDAFETGRVSQAFTTTGGERVRYTWEQRVADPLTGRVQCAMHFVVGTGRARAAGRFSDAFVYDWRLWSVPELRDAMAEAGLERTEVYPRRPEGVDGDGNYFVMPVEDAAEVGTSFGVYVVGRPAGRAGRVSSRRTRRP